MAAARVDIKQFCMLRNTNCGRPGWAGHTTRTKPPLHKTVELCSCLTVFDISTFWIIDVSRRARLVASCIDICMSRDSDNCCYKMADSKKGSLTFISSAKSSLCQSGLLQDHFVSFTPHCKWCKRNIPHWQSLPASARRHFCLVPMKLRLFSSSNRSAGGFVLD